MWVWFMVFYLRRFKRVWFDFFIVSIIVYLGVVRTVGVGMGEFFCKGIWG